MREREGEGEEEEEEERDNEEDSTWGGEGEFWGRWEVGESGRRLGREFGLAFWKEEKEVVDGQIVSDLLSLSLFVSFSFSSVVGF